MTNDALFDRVSPARRQPKSAILAAIAIAIVTLVLWGQLSQYRHGDVGRVADRALVQSDFAAFYCAALVARTGGDPYKFAPLGSCEETRVFRPGGSTLGLNGLDPAPLPGYDFALFAPLTFLPYRTAGLLWIAILIAANFAASFGLARLTGIHVAIVLATLAVTNGIICYTFGQEQPVVTLVLVAAAMLLRAERPKIAAVVASFTLIEPHVGLPVMLTLFFWTKARAVVIACCAAFGLASLAFMGLPLNLEYFLHVLPVHAFAEVTVWFQYSLTALLNSIGVPANLALRLASIQYALLNAFAIAIGGQLARKIGKPALVLFPAACAVVGGPYIHITQIAGAIPFALYIAAFVPKFRGLAWVAVIFLATLWPEAYLSTQIIAAVAIFGAAFYALANRPQVQRFAIGAIAFALWFAINFALVKAPYANFRPVPSHAQVAKLLAPYDPSLASTRSAMQEHGDPIDSELSVRRIVARLPAWTGLLILVFIGFTIARKPQRYVVST